MGAGHRLRFIDNDIKAAVEEAAIAGRTNSAELTESAEDLIDKESNYATAYTATRSLN